MANEGLSTVNLANAWLDTLSNTSFAAGATPHVQLHTGNPGAAGASNVSAINLRKPITWAAASGGSKAIAATLPSWTNWTAGAETITAISFHSALTAGTFYFSILLTASKAVSNGDTLNITAASVSLSPLAAA